MATILGLGLFSIGGLPLTSAGDPLLKSVHFILAQSGTSTEFRPLSF